MSQSYPPSVTAPPLRTDIQALRGWAVLMVVGYHTSEDWVAAGFLGVDIFFVISGYLITSLVIRGIATGRFDFAEFYFRRAKRLLPAAYVTFAATTLGAHLLLTNREYLDFLEQLAGAITFTGNLALLQQTGYFGGEAELKPLLHVWSLSLEEQYYLLLPALLVFTPRRFWSGATLLILGASILFCLVLVQFSPESAFYLLPARAWELALGSLGVLAFERNADLKEVNLLFWPSLAVVLLLPVIPAMGGHPGGSAIVVCLATLILLLRNHPALNGGFFVRNLARVGDFSYSLYLVHWPVFALVNNGWVAEVPSTVRLAAAVGSLILGYLLYRAVELPVRRAALLPTRRHVELAVASSLALLALPLGVLGAHDYRSAVAAPGSPEQRNPGFSLECDYHQGFTARAECRDAPHPRIMIWGDSVAMHLVPGIAAASQAGVIQATRSACAPLLGMAHFSGAYPTGYFTRNWAKSCLLFNQSVIDYLARTPGIEVVILSSSFARYVDSAEYLQLISTRGGLSEAIASTAVTVEYLRRTVERIRELGKRVVVISPPPVAGFDLGRCHERLVTGRPLWGAHSDCAITTQAHRREMREVIGLLDLLPTVAKVGVIRLDELLCDSLRCVTTLAGTPLYLDQIHLSTRGSLVLARETGLVGLIMNAAR